MSISLSLSTSRGREEAKEREVVREKETEPVSMSSDQDKSIVTREQLFHVIERDADAINEFHLSGPALLPALATVGPIHDVC